MKNNQSAEKNISSENSNNYTEKFDVIKFDRKDDKKQTNTATLNNKKYQTTILEEDIFDDDGNIQEDSEVNNLITNAKSLLLVYFNKLSNFIEYKILKKIFNPFIKISNKIINIANNFVKSLSNLIKIKKSTELEQIEEKEEEVIEEQFNLGTFSKTKDLNITFIDNYDIPLYKTVKSGFQSLTKSEEDLIMTLAINSIKECAEFTMEMPPAKEGIYKGRSIYELMSNVSEEEVCIFLGYVNGIPKRYIGHSWKISETYATWLISNAPLYVEKGK